jgi:hypothetical protein
MIYHFVLLAVLFVGCSTVNTSSLDSKLEVEVSPYPSPPSSPQIYEAKFIRQEGWKIPLPEKRKKTRTIERDVKSENGKSVKRILTIYIPKDDFFYQREVGISNSGNELKSELLKLQSIWEIKANEKKYSYTITARKAKPDEQEDHQHDFIYRYFDLDGDGKFETLISNDSEVLVPSWATQ